MVLSDNGLSLHGDRSVCLCSQLVLGLLCQHYTLKDVTWVNAVD